MGGGITLKRHNFLYHWSGQGATGSQITNVYTCIVRKKKILLNPRIFKIVIKSTKHQQS